MYFSFKEQNIYIYIYIYRLMYYEIKTPNKTLKNRDWEKATNSLRFLNGKKKL
ncbi:MAG: hypothetical protein N7Q72_02990 [Spiroplasma sp. Tabriz.8]|nr:hypothetical protein [Spiroplasma sp. Tabriz.8]